MLGKKLAIDIGTAMLRMQVKGEQPTAPEPSLVAVEEGSGRVLGAGAAASQLVVGRSTATLIAPVHDGALGDLAAFEALLQHALTRGVGRQRIFKPDVMLAVTAAMSGRDLPAPLGVTVAVRARTPDPIHPPLA